ncbi:MAG: alpha/beta hydrolase [Bacteroidales bacterium]|nr:alpha/beta hydrolase [Bacteroidales bacterium]
MKRLLQYPLPEGNPGELINNLAPSDPRKAGLLALRFFCTPIKGGGFTEKENKFLSDSEQRRYKVLDFEIQTYRWHGPGKRVLLAHGWDDNAARWRPVISMLKSEGFDIVAMDAPAHGKSGSEIANGVLYAESIRVISNSYLPEIVIGHSFGGLSVSSCCGKSEIQSIKKLILMAAPSKLSTSFDQFYKSQGLNQKAREAVSSTFEEVFGFEISYFTTADFVKKIPASGLIIQDEQDPIIPLEESKIVHQCWQGSELMITQNLGHSLQAPSVFRKIIDFCKD